MIVILKNPTGSAVTVRDTGVTIPANTNYTVPDQDYPLWAASANVQTLIAAGTLVVNDGFNDLSATDGGYFVDYPHQAFSQRFWSPPNRANGFTAKNTQQAIEEARDTAQGKIRYLVNCGFDGTASSGRYLEYNSNVDSNLSGFVLPAAATLKEISICVNSNGTGTMQVLSWNGTTETLLTSISLSNARKAAVTGLTISLAALAELRVKCSSGSLSRPIVFKLLQPT